MKYSVATHFRWREGRGWPDDDYRIAAVIRIVRPKVTNQWPWETRRRAIRRALSQVGLVRGSAMLHIRELDDGIIEVVYHDRLLALLTPVPESTPTTKHKVAPILRTRSIPKFRYSLRKAT